MKLHSERPHKCDQCNKSYVTLSKLRAHQGVHSGFKCDKCGKILGSRRNLSRHLAMMHRLDLSYECKSCLKNFRSHVDFVVHMRSHDVLKPFHCSKCSRQFAHFDSLKEHLKIHFGGDFFTTTSRKIHITSEGIEINRPDGKLYQCCQCDEKFSSSEDLKIHMQCHVEISFECKFCSEIFYDSNPYKVHMKNTHQITRPFRCCKCDRHFPTFVNLRDHLKGHFGKMLFKRSKVQRKHNISFTSEGIDMSFRKVKSFECTGCEKSFSNCDKLQEHEKFHQETQEHVLGNETKHSADYDWQMQSLDDPFKCDACGRDFSELKTLRAHLKRKHAKLQPSHRSVFGNIKNIKSDTREKQLLKCQECGMLFALKSRFVLHMRKHTREKSFTCPTCNKTFFEKKALQRHLKKHKKSELEIHLSTHSKNAEKKDSQFTPSKYKCEECGKFYSSLYGMKLHRLTHVQERLFVCQWCGQSFKTHEYLRMHERNHTALRSHKCTRCGKGFKNKNRLLIHTRIHTGEKLYICDICGKSFGQEPHLKTHFRTHTGEKPYKCDTCGNCFAHSFTLVKHKRNIHSGKNASRIVDKPLKPPGPKLEKLNINLQSPVNCDICGENLPNYQSLRSHLRESHSLFSAATVQSPLKPYQCSVCHKKYANYYYLVCCHMKIHEGEGHQCNTCGKAFSTKNQVIEHMKVHTGEKPHTCSTCGRGFGTLVNLKRHMRTHTGEKPFKCHICGRGFTVSSMVYVHMKTHTGEKPWKCFDCGQGFSEKRSLLRHINKQHSPSLFESNTNLITKDNQGS